MYIIITTLGGTPDSQKEFLETLSSDPSNPQLSNEKRKGRIPSVANEFALGYTYQDVLDADHDGMASGLRLCCVQERAC